MEVIGDNKALEGTDNGSDMSDTSLTLHSNQITKRFVYLEVINRKYSVTFIHFANTLEQISPFRRK